MKISKANIFNVRFFEGEGDPPPEKTFKQEDVNKIVAEERRKFKEQQDKTIKELESFKDKAKLTATEKADIEKQLEELRSQHLTTEEKLKQEADNLKKKAEQELTTEREASSRWQNLFTESSIRNEILSAAVHHKSFNPEHIVQILRPTSRLVETMDDAGKPTGKFTTKVKFNSKNDKGEVKELDLTPQEVVAKLKEQTEEYGYLFRDDSPGGTGGNRTKGTPAGNVDISKLSFDQFKEKRKELGLKK